ncbi:putative anthocyanidin reductase [Chenopodium quinoa]|uniref:putative anthocyanidin reductase n=1 Tax=Chenopodium quinoa TaxID=63459 RepID=UPI000B794841|nr:putative anthocyanidin reductase [Chenopodium quinoa]
MEDNGGNTSRKFKTTSIVDEAKTYCVTGATGYIGSWLVKALLLKGCKVCATVRDLEKASYLKTKWENEDRLKLIKADLQDEGSFDEALENCDGVFHVAASMEFNIKDQANIESYVQSNIIDPAIKGTLNLLKACKRSKSVKRVVLTSSISTITAKDDEGNWISVVDESCQVSIDHVWNTRASGWVYVLSKLSTEEAAFKFANENGLDLVSVITTTVAGPFLTSTVPSSVRVLLSPITGDPELFPILKAVNARMGSIGLVHIEDICNAHIFLMEHPNSEGRYMCCTQNCHMSQLLELLAQSYPSTSNMNWSNDEGIVPSVISSKKLKDLGFEYKHDLVTIINHTIKQFMECDYLPSFE